MQAKQLFSRSRRLQLERHEVAVEVANEQYDANALPFQQWRLLKVP